MNNITKRLFDESIIIFDNSETIYYDDRIRIYRIYNKHSISDDFIISYSGRIIYEYIEVLDSNFIFCKFLLYYHGSKWDTGYFEIKDKKELIDGLCIYKKYNLAAKN